MSMYQCEFRSRGEAISARNALRDIYRGTGRQLQPGHYGVDGSTLWATKGVSLSALERATSHIRPRHVRMR